MTTEDFVKISSTLPTGPGVYQFRDKYDTDIYIGKAKNLKKRLSSYFGQRKQQTHKTRTMVKNADHILYTLVDTETDALLLESTLIKERQPRYNVMLKDGKSYSYVCIKKERFPRVFLTRKVFKDGSLYFGPYTSRHQISVILELIKMLFPLRTCKFQLSPKNIEAQKFKVCLEYHIENCKGPCADLQSEEDYNNNIEQIKNILRGHFGLVKSHIKEHMHRCAEELRFEEAEKWRIRLEAFQDYQSKSTVVHPMIEDVDVFSIVSQEDIAFINYIKVVQGAIINSFTQEVTLNMEESDELMLQHGILHLREKFQSKAPELILPMDVHLPSEMKVTVPQRGDKKKLLDLSTKNATFFLKRHKAQKLSKTRRQINSERILSTLRDDLHMDSVPLHIECFDNSNIQGSHPVASCVVFKNARPSKKDYRHFKIKTVVGPDDFASMTEVVHRRYQRLLTEKQDLPQLIIIDGGKGQLSSAMKSIESLGLQERITVIGIAKKLEEIYFPGDPIPLHIDKRSESLRLIQQLRNEAHRFAITFHRDQRSKDFVASQLTRIPGIGGKTAQTLLSKFGSVSRLRQASFDKIAEEVGPSKAHIVRSWMEEE